MPTQPVPATDSAAELHKLIGDDATATFENDPTFVESNPTRSASSENLAEQRTGAEQEFQAAKSVNGAGPDADEEDDALEDEEDDEDDLDDDEDDLEDEEDEDEIDDEDEDDDEYEDDDDEDEDDEEDDADEVEASASPLRADGLLGYEDEADDVKNGVDRVTGDGNRKREQARTLTNDPDRNSADADAELDSEAERKEQDDSNVVIRPVKPTDFASAYQPAA